MKKQSKNKPKVQFPEGCVGIQTLRRSFLLLASKGSHYPNFYDKILRPLLFERKTVVIEDYVQMDTDDERTAHCKKKKQKKQKDVGIHFYCHHQAVTTKPKKKHLK